MRKFATIKTSIWEDADYLKLTAQAKLLYQFLLEQADLTLCGAIPLREGRWKGPLGFALPAPLAALEEARFVVIDRDHEELWVRTFMRHGQVWGKGIKGAQNSLDSVRSPKIRAALAEEYPELADEWDVYPSSDGGSDGGADQRETGNWKRETGNERRETRDLAVSASSHPAVPAGVVVGDDDDVLMVTASGTAPRSVVGEQLAKPTSAGTNGDHPATACPDCGKGLKHRVNSKTGEPFLACPDRACNYTTPDLSALPKPRQPEPPDELPDPDTMRPIPADVKAKLDKFTRELSAGMKPS